MEALATTIKAKKYTFIEKQPEIWLNIFHFSERVKKVQPNGKFLINICIVAKKNSVWLNLAKLNDEIVSNLWNIFDKHNPSYLF